MQAMARNVRKKIQREMAKEEDGAAPTAPSLVLQPPPTAQQHQSSVRPPPLLELPAPHEPPPTAPQLQGSTPPPLLLQLPTKVPQHQGSATPPPVLQPPPTAPQAQLQGSAPPLRLLQPPPAAPQHQDSAPPPPLLQPPPTAPQLQSSAPLPPLLQAAGTHSALQALSPTSRLQPPKERQPPLVGFFWAEDTYFAHLFSALQLLNSNPALTPETVTDWSRGGARTIFNQLCSLQSEPKQPEPTSRQLAAGVGSNPNIYRWHDAFHAKNPQRLAKQQVWCKDVARQAERCGYNEDHSYCDTHRLGEWWECDEVGYDVYLPEFREIQFERLDAHAQPPSDEELSGLKFPQRLWWSDRDRIALLHEFLLAEPPDGSYRWEEKVLLHSWTLWSSYLDDGVSLNGFYIRSESDDEGEIDLGHCKVASSQGGLLAWPSGYKYLPAPGWRLLSSMASCPNPWMRYPTLASSIPIDEYNLLL